MGTVSKLGLAVLLVGSLSVWTDRAGLAYGATGGGTGSSGGSGAASWAAVQGAPQQDLLNVPRVGQTQTSQWRGHSWQGSGMDQGVFKGLLVLGAGTQGIVRNVHWTGAQGHDTDTALLTNLVLRVYVDMGTIPDYDNPPENNLVVYAPLSVLLSGKYQFGNSVKGTRWLDTQKKSGADAGFDLKLNMPFTNGIFVAIFSGNTNAFYAYSAVTYELGALAFPYSGWRLHGDYFAGHSTANQVDGGSSILRTYMAVSNAPGFLVGAFYSNQGTTNGTQWEEGNWYGWSDNPGRSFAGLPQLWSSYGGEDLFKNSYYFINGANLNYDYGTEYFATTRNVSWHDSMEGYRWFGNEAPSWTNNFYFERQIASDSANLVEDVITFYYAGAGATNVLYQGEALNYFQRAGISNTLQKLAVNDLVVNAKGSGWWGKCDAIYPFIGGAGPAHAQNLKSANWTITWTGSPTHDGNGVTGNGTTAYGDTGFNPSTAGGVYAQNSAHVLVYSGTASPTDGGTFVGGNDNVVRRAGLSRSGTGLQGSGLNVDLSNAGGPTITTFNGVLAFSRTTSTIQHIYARKAFDATANATATSGMPNANILLLARGWGGFFAVDQFSNVNLRGASFGSGLTLTDSMNESSDWDYFEDLLGTTGLGTRKAP